MVCVPISEHGANVMSSSAHCPITAEATISTWNTPAWSRMSFSTQYIDDSGSLELWNLVDLVS